MGVDEACLASSDIYLGLRGLEDLGFRVECLGPKQCQIPSKGPEEP